MIIKLPAIATNILLTLGSVGLWYIFSIGLTFYNRWLFKEYGMHYPFSVTTIHMMVNWTLCWLTRIIIQRYTGKARSVLSWWHTMTKVLPCAVAAALDIGLSNSSLLFITVTLYTMAKSSSIVFLLFFAILFKLEKFKFNIVFVVLCISFGLLLFSYGSTTIDPVGLVMILAAALSSGLRWTLVQFLLQGRQSHSSSSTSSSGSTITVSSTTTTATTTTTTTATATTTPTNITTTTTTTTSSENQTVAGQLHGPIDTLYHLTPAMAICLLPISLVFEGPALFSSNLLHSSFETAMRTFTALFVGSFLAFLMNVSEYLLLWRTSGLVLSVAGIFKDVCTISISAFILQEDTFSSVNIAGSVVVFIGIIHFHYIKYTEFQTGHSHGGKSSHGRNNNNNNNNNNEMFDNHSSNINGNGDSKQHIKRRSRTNKVSSSGSTDEMYSLRSNTISSSPSGDIYHVNNQSEFTTKESSLLKNLSFFEKLFRSQVPVEKRSKRRRANNVRNNSYRHLENTSDEEDEFEEEEEEEDGEGVEDDEFNNNNNNHNNNNNNNHNHNHNHNNNNINIHININDNFDLEGKAATSTDNKRFFINKRTAPTTTGTFHQNGNENGNGNSFPMKVFNNNNSTTSSGSKVVHLSEPKSRNPHTEHFSDSSLGFQYPIDGLQSTSVGSPPPPPIHSKYTSNSNSSSISVSLPNSHILSSPRKF